MVSSCSLYSLWSTVKTGQAVCELLNTINRLIPENGVFVQAQHFLVDRKKVQAVFNNMRTVLFLRNVPQVFVFYSRKGAGS